MCKGIIGYEAHQVSVLAIMVTKKYEYEHKKHSFQIHIIQRLTLGNLKFAQIMNQPIIQIKGVRGNFYTSEIVILD